MKRNKLGLLLTLVLAGLTQARANVRFLPDGAIDTAPEVAVVNDNFRYLNTGKLDLKPGNIIPREDSRYDIGASGQEFANLYVDSINASSLSVSTFTASSATVTALSVSTLTVTRSAFLATLSGCTSIGKATCNSDGLMFDVVGDGIFGAASNARAEIGGGGYAHSGAFTNHEYRLRTNNTDRVTIDTSGNSGFGLTSGISARLHVQSAVGDEAAFFSDGSNYTIGVARIPSVTGGWIYGTSGSAFALGADNTEAFRIKTNGTVRIGPSSVSEAGNKLDLTSSSGEVLLGFVGTSVSGDIGMTGSDMRLRTGTSEDIAFHPGDAGEKVVFEEDGQVGIGGTPTTSPNARLSVFHGNSDDTPYRTFRSDAGGNDVSTNFREYTTVSVSSTSATTIAQISNYCGLMIIAGDNSVDFFADVILAGVGGGAPTVITSRTALGAPGARTYTTDGSGNIQLQMAAGTAGSFGVHTFTIDLDNR